MRNTLQRGWSAVGRVCAASLIGGALVARADPEPWAPLPPSEDIQTFRNTELHLPPPPADIETARQSSSWLFTSPNAHGERLWSQTKLMLGVGVIAVGALYAMPASITGWDKDIKVGDLPSRWWDNVSHGPVWDTDDWFFNYVTHPYCGGVYYVMARKSGYSQRDSFIYSALMSTFFWEYGIEAFAENPSIQDLITTPVGGWLYGEWAYHREQEIIANGGRLLGSRFLGSIARFFIDPMDRMGSWINRRTGRNWIYTGDVSIRPLAFATPGAIPANDDVKVTFRLAVRF